MEYLFEKKAIRYYHLVFIPFIAVGSTLKLSIVWTFSDIANGLMAMPNLIGLIALSGVVAAETQRFLATDPRRKMEKTLMHEALKWSK